MQTYKAEPPGASTPLQSVQIEVNPKQLLFSSEKHNDIPATRKPRRVASRYMSGILYTSVSTPGTPKRSPSPTVSTTSLAAGMSMPKRTQSVERTRPTIHSPRFSAPSSPSRPSTPSPSSRSSTPVHDTVKEMHNTTRCSPSRPSTPSPSSRSSTPVHDTVKEMHNTTRCLLSNKADGLWPSMRSLSSSFQSESIVVPPSKGNMLVAPSSSDKSNKAPAVVLSGTRRTPMRRSDLSDQLENSKPLENVTARVIDQHRWPGVMGGGRLSTNIMTRSMDLTDKTSTPARTIVSRGVSPKRTNVSSDGESRVPRLLGDVAERLSKYGSIRAERDMKPIVNPSSQSSVRSSSVTGPSITKSSRSPGLNYQLSPTKVLSASSSRSILSPSRTRLTPMQLSANVTRRASGTVSVSKYTVNLQRGKLTGGCIEDAHQLKLLHNASLQWRFVKAQANKTLSIQKMRSENVFLSVWNSISMLRDSVIIKRIDVQHLHQEIKLGMILKEQMAYLEGWAALERDHCNSLSGAVEALNASTLRLPVIGGAKANIIDVRNAVSSAVDVLQAMGFSICCLLSKIEGAKSLVSELSAVAAKEKSMHDECRELLASMAMMQVQESSLRIHVMQRRQDASELE